jgi:prolyl-tRNA synthetase
MRMTKSFIRTLREDPTEAESKSHKLMLRAGMIKQIASGIYSYMPICWKSIQKIESIIREEMDFVGAQELRMPTLHPMDIWEKSGRVEAMGETLFRLSDRRERDLVIAPTHEEVITMMVKEHAQSYRDLPLILYQIQTKFRDEARPRAGLLRVREFDMKDAYSFHVNEDSLDKDYQKIAKAYSNIYSRCGVPAIQAEADSGAIGGKDSHEFILPSETGEDTVFICDHCGYAANVEKAQSIKPKPPTGTKANIEEIYTPGIKTIHQLTSHLEIADYNTLKTVLYFSDGEVILITLRGDLEVNEVKLKNLLHSNLLRLATEEESVNAGLHPGYVSVLGIKHLTTVADDSISLGVNFVVGANKTDYHLTNVNYPRDFTPTLIADIATAQDGHACIHCNSQLRSCKGIEIGHIFKLGTFYANKFDASFLDQNGALRNIIMGCYGIGIGRLLAASIECNNDEDGIIFPKSISPYQVHLLALNTQDEEVTKVATSIYQDMLAKGIDVLYDDRPETAGVKFKDADLLGFPFRIVVSNRNLKEGSVELKNRASSDTSLQTIESVVSVVEQLITS